MHFIPSSLQDLLSAYGDTKFAWTKHFGVRYSTLNDITCICIQNYMHPTLFPGFSWSCLQSQNTRRYNARDGRIFRPSYSTSTRTMGSRNTYWPSNKCSLAGKYNHPILCKNLPFRACIRLPPVKFLHLLICNLVGLVSQEILFSWLNLPGDTI